MVAAVTAATALVVIAKVAVVAFAGTVTDGGTVAASRLLASVTTAPAAGAAMPSVTVPVLPAPPVTTAGLTPRPASPAGAFTTSVTIRDAPALVAVMFTGVYPVTTLVVT